MLFDITYFYAQYLQNAILSGENLTDWISFFNTSIYRGIKVVLHYIHFKLLFLTLYHIILRYWFTYLLNISMLMYSYLLPIAVFPSMVLTNMVGNIYMGKYLPVAENVKYTEVNTCCYSFFGFGSWHHQLPKHCVNTYKCLFHY